MKLLEKLETYKTSEKIALKCENEKLSYKELWEYSENLANYLSKNLKKNEPLVVYGHKNPYMIVCFLACVKSGHTYCPVDTSISPERLNDIVNTVKPEIVLSCIDKEVDGFNTLTINDIMKISKENKKDCDKNNYISSQYLIWQHMLYLKLSSDGRYLFYTVGDIPFFWSDYYRMNFFIVDTKTGNKVNLNRWEKGDRFYGIDW